MSYRNPFKGMKSRMRGYAQNFNQRIKKRKRPTKRQMKIFGFSLGTVAIVLAAAYIFIAPVKNFINGLIGQKNV